jgi:hypothetical protein
LHEYTLLPLVPLYEFGLHASWIGPALPGQFIYYPYRDISVLQSPITPLYAVANSGPKLEGCDPKWLADQYCTSHDNLSVPLLSDIHHIEERVRLTKFIWGLIQGATNRAAAWGRSETAKRKRKRDERDDEEEDERDDERDDDEKRLSEGPTTRSRSSVRSSRSSTVDRRQDKGKQKAGDIPGTKRKMDSASLTGQALQTLEKRQRCDNWEAAISNWVVEVGH